MKKEYEEPCDNDGKLCDWVWDDDSTTSDLYCIKCGRYRDWSKEERMEI